MNYICKKIWHCNYAWS